MFNVLKGNDILLFARVPMNLVCLRSIYEKLKCSYRFYYSFKNAGDFEISDFRNCVPGAVFIPSIIAKYIKWRLYLTSDIYLLSKNASCKIYTFHGVSFKGRSYTHKVLMYDRLFIIGPYMLERFIKLGILKENDKRILKVGMPKLDSLVDGTWDICNSREYLGIFEHQYNFVALYAPTWGVASSFYSYIDVIVNVITSMNGCLIIKLHDHLLHHKDVKRKIDMYRYNPNVLVYESYDIIPAMAAADFLITDLSSVANEFLVLDRPIVFLWVPSSLERYGDTLDKEMVFRGGVLVDRPDAVLLEKTITDVLAHPEIFSEDRRFLKNYLFYNLGKATSVAVSYIKEILS